MKIKRFKESYGKNPWDPWSAKAGLDETSAAQLDKFLLSRGINPRYVTKDTKIAHSKSNQFKQWASVHMEDVQEQMTPAHQRQQDIKKKLHTRSTEIKTPRGPGSHNEEINVQEEKSDDVGEMVKDKLRIIIHNAKKMHDELKDSDDLPEWVKSKITLAQDYVSTAHDYTCGTHELGEEIKKPTGDLKDACWKGYTAVGMKIKDGRKVPNCVPEEVELDEAKVKPIKIKIKTPTPTAAEKMYAKHQELRKKANLPDPEQYKQIGAQKQKEIDTMKNESVLIDDPKGTMTRVAERKKEMTRSARIIKSIYKKNNVKSVKEELYDHEKDKKDPARVYGKAPKMVKADEVSNSNDSKSKAAAILSGGTTLTKQKRDTVELDPTMNTRPGIQAGDDNASKKKL